MRMPLLRVEHLTTCFPRRKPFFFRGKPTVTAVDDVSFDIEANTTVGLIGERGCGKTTLAHTIARLIPASSGHVHFQERDILRMSARAFRPLRRDMQVLFQDGLSSLNPFATVENTLIETIRAAVPGLPTARKRQRAAALLERVGLPAETGALMPRELGHGQPERVALARALCVEPRLILIDDTLRALDLRQQREFVNLLVSLREEHGLSYLFATHDFDLLMLLADHVLVMSRGKLLESAPLPEIVGNPQHEFTKKLLASTMTLS